MFTNNHNETTFYWEFPSAAGVKEINPNRPEYQASATGPKNTSSLGFTQASSSHPRTWNRPEYQASATGPKNTSSLGFTQASSSHPRTWNASGPEFLTNGQHTTCIPRTPGTFAPSKGSGPYGQFITSKIDGKMTTTFVRATYRRATLSEYDIYKTSGANIEHANHTCQPKVANQMDLDN